MVDYEKQVSIHLETSKHDPIEHTVLLRTTTRYLTIPSSPKTYREVTPVNFSEVIRPSRRFSSILNIFVFLGLLVVPGSVLFLHKGNTHHSTLILHFLSNINSYPYTHTKLLELENFSNLSVNVQIKSSIVFLTIQMT